MGSLPDIMLGSQQCGRQLICSSTHACASSLVHDAVGLVHQHANAGVISCVLTHWAKLATQVEGVLAYHAAQHAGAWPCSTVCVNFRGCTSAEPPLPCRQGWLPEDYRTAICPALIEAGACSARSSCVHAHTLEELRAEAAVRGGKLPKDFRTSFCEDALAGGEVPMRCSYQKARNWQECMPDARLARAILAGALQQSMHNLDSAKALQTATTSIIDYP